MFYVNDEPEDKFLYTETIKLYCIVLCVQSEGERNQNVEHELPDSKSD